MKKAALLISIFFLSLVSYFLFLPPAFASSSAPPSTNVNSNVPNNPHYSTQSTIIEIMSAITCQLSGIDPINPKQSCLGIDQKSNKIGFLPSPQTGGAIGSMGNLITMLYTPPLHTGDYFQNLAQNFGITKHAFAQTTGTGFEGLKPLIGIWSAFRNIVYLFFVIVFIVIGLAIMLRVKIDPRTVMTIQNQIPKIIIGILLITFSYAISGFLIDMMYVSIHLVGNIIVSADGKNKNNFGLVRNVSTASNPFQAIGALNESGSISGMSNLAWKPAEAVSKPVAVLFDNTGGRIITGIAGYVLGTQLKKIAQQAVAGAVNTVNALGKLLAFIGIIAAPATGGASLLISATPLIFQSFSQVISGTIGGIAGLVLGPNILGLLISIVVFFIILIALLVALFRLWFALLMAYIHILLDVVLAPFWIIGGIIPGSPISIGGWLRDIGSNLLAFPVTIAMFLLGKVFVDAFANNNINNFVPPLVGNRLDPEALGAIIGLGVILITPNILDVLKAALKAPKTDAGIGKSIGAGNPLNIINRTGQMGFTLSGLANIPGVRKLPFMDKIMPGGHPQK